MRRLNTIISDLNVCKICENSYSKPEHEPRMLRCGHTLCLYCLMKIMENNNECPNCK